MRHREGNFVRLSARKGVIREIQLLDFREVRTEQEWEDVLATGFTRLSDQYGTATEVNSYPLVCRGRMLGCTLQRQLGVLTVWRWPSGTTLEYAVTTVAGRAATRESYRALAGRP